MKLQRMSVLAVGLLLLVASAALARKWTDNTGKYSVEAELVDVQGDKVALKKSTGSVITMPIARLSKADQDYLTDLVARRNAQQGAAPDQPNEGPNQTATVGRRAIEAALDKRHDFSIRQMPLREAIQNLLEPEEIPYYVNWPALADELGVRGEEPVEFAAKGIVVRDAVNKLLGSLDMGWLIRDEVLYITGPIDSEMPRNSEPIVYRTSLSRVRMDSLAKGIRSKVFPPSWDTAGGPGRVTALGDRVVVIFQIPAVHREILRHYGKTLEPVYATGRKAFERSPGEALSPTQVIRQVTKCDFLNVPLKEATAELQAAHGLKIEFDTAALDNWGVSVDSRVTLQLNGVRLESALNLLTEQVDLGWYVDGEHVAITHRVDAQEKKLSDIVYDVGDLVQAAGEDSLPSIAAAIRATVRTPLGRRAVGRPDPVQATGAGKLRVRACFADHRRIGRLLDDLRAAYGLTPTEGDR
ncbi:hypothetical protein HQ535_01965 [bacterium]|nr:hypothetical protein [bacterium]